jgi:uncharacterized membrane protein (DUF485 family)
MMWSERSWLFSFIMWVVWFVVMKGLIVMDSYIHGMVKVKREFNVYHGLSCGFKALILRRLVSDVYIVVHSYPPQWRSG